MRYGSPGRPAALLGRFLPRLGPFVHASGPFLWQGALFGRGARDGKAGNTGGERVHHGLEVVAQTAKTVPLLKARLIHVEGAVDLDLEHVLGLVRPAVMLGDVASGIGLVEGPHSPAPSIGWRRA